jgi:hypothetical protein
MNLAAESVFLSGSHSDARKIRPTQRNARARCTDKAEKTMPQHDKHKATLQDTFVASQPAGGSHKTRVQQATRHPATQRDTVRPHKANRINKPNARRHARADLQEKPVPSAQEAVGDLITHSLNATTEEWDIYKKATKLAYDLGLTRENTLTAYLTRAASNCFPVPSTAAFAALNRSGISFHPGPEALAANQIFPAPMLDDNSYDVPVHAIRATRHTTTRLRFYALFNRVSLKCVILTALAYETRRISSINKGHLIMPNVFDPAFTPMTAAYQDAEKKPTDKENILLPPAVYQTWFKGCHGRLSQYLDTLLPSAPAPLQETNITDAKSMMDFTKFYNDIKEVGLSVVASEAHHLPRLQRCRFVVNHPDLPARIDLTAAYLNMNRAELLTAVVDGSIRRRGSPF